MLNHINIMGRLVAEPDLRTTGTGVKVASFRIASDRDYMNGDGTRETDFVDCVAWRASAEFLTRNFHKGMPILVSVVSRSETTPTKTAIAVVQPRSSLTICTSPVGSVELLPPLLLHLNSQNWTMISVICRLRWEMNFRCEKARGNHRTDNAQPDT